MSLKLFPIVAAIGLAAAIAPATSAATIKVVTATIPGGPFSPANEFGTIHSQKLSTAYTYYFNFDLSKPGDVLTQVQASIGGPQKIQFSVYEGAAPASGSYTHAPPEGILVDESLKGIGPSLTDLLHAGDYYIKIDYVAKTNELLTGGFDVSAVPEPASWSMMLLGAGAIGAVMRGGRRREVFAA
jgi:hypothetical protein